MSARAGAPVLALLPESIPRIFEQAQTSTANHQKNFVALNKLHNEAALVTETSGSGKKEQFTGEVAFEDLFINMVIRILPLKKGATVVDRIVKFVAGYVKFINEKGIVSSYFSFLHSLNLQLQRSLTTPRKKITHMPQDLFRDSSSTS